MVKNKVVSVMIEGSIWYNRTYAGEIEVVFLRKNLCSRYYYIYAGSPSWRRVLRVLEGKDE